MFKQNLLTITICTSFTIFTTVSMLSPHLNPISYSHTILSQTLFSSTVNSANYRVRHVKHED